MSEQFTVTMLGGFEVSRDGLLLDLPPSCQRLVALAALKRRAVPRSWLCRTLWPTTRPDRATARLRTTLWRLRPMGAGPLLRSRRSRSRSRPMWRWTGMSRSI